MKNFQSRRTIFSVCMSSNIGFRRRKDGISAILEGPLFFFHITKDVPTCSGIIAYIINKCKKTY